MTLEEAIDQCLNLGDNDPYEVVTKIKRRHGKSWLAEQLLEKSDEFIADLVRGAINRRRNSVMVRDSHEKKEHAVARKAETSLLLQTKWVPRVGYKRLADLTVSDLEKVRDHYVMLRDSMDKRVNLCNEWIHLMRQNNARTVGGLAKKVELPALEEVVE